MKIVIKKGKEYLIVYYLLWVIYSFMFFLCQQTELQFMYNTSSLYQYISLVVGGMLLFLFLLTTKISKLKNLVIYGSVTLILGLSLLILHDKYLIVMFGFILLGRKVDPDQLIKVDLATKICVLSTVLFMWWIGFIPNYSSYINGAYKQALGFSHPNMLANVVYIVLLEWMYIHYNKMKIWEHAMILMFAGVVWNVAASRTSAYTFIIIYVCMIISKFLPNIFQKGIVVNLFALLPMLLTVVSFYLIRLYNNGNAFAIAINEITTRRLKQASIMLNQYGVSMFGQFVDTRGSRSLNYDANAVFNVDMAYIAIPVRYGIFILLLILLGYFFFIKKTAKNKNNKLLLFTVYFIILGFAETYFYRIQYNVTIAFLLIYVINLNYSRQSRDRG